MEDSSLQSDKALTDVERSIAGMVKGGSIVLYFLQRPLTDAQGGPCGARSFFLIEVMTSPQCGNNNGFGVVLYVHSVSTFLSC